MDGWMVGWMDGIGWMGRVSVVWAGVGIAVDWGCPFGA